MPHAMHPSDTHHHRWNYLQGILTDLFSLRTSVLTSLMTLVIWPYVKYPSASCTEDITWGGGGGERPVHVICKA